MMLKTVCGYLREIENTQPGDLLFIFFLIALFLVDSSHLHYNVVNVDAKQFRAKITKSTKLSRVHARFYCNANEQSCEKGYFSGVVKFTFFL